MLSLKWPACPSTLHTCCSMPRHVLPLIVAFSEATSFMSTHPTILSTPLPCLLSLGVVLCVTSWRCATIICWWVHHLALLQRRFQACGHFSWLSGLSEAPGGKQWITWDGEIILWGDHIWAVTVLGLSSSATTKHLTTLLLLVYFHYSHLGSLVSCVIYN